MGHWGCGRQKVVHVRVWGHVHRVEIDWPGAMMETHVLCSGAVLISALGTSLILLVAASLSLVLCSVHT